MKRRISRLSNTTPLLLAEMLLQTICLVLLPTFDARPSHLSTHSNRFAAHHAALHARRLLLLLLMVHIAMRFRNATPVPRPLLRQKDFGQSAWLSPNRLDTVPPTPALD